MCSTAVFFCGHAGDGRTGVPAKHLAGYICPARGFESPCPRSCCSAGMVTGRSRKPMPPASGNRSDSCLQRLCSHCGIGRHGGFKPRCPQGVRVRIPLGAFFVDTIRFRSRIGICAGLRTRAGMTTAGSSPAGSTLQEWRNRHTRPPQKRWSEGPNPSSCTLSGCLERYTGMAQNHVSFGTCGSESRSGYHAVMPQPVPGRS